MTELPRDLMEVAKDAARIGGAILREGFGTLKPDQIDLKGLGDYVTDLDRRSEEAIKNRIREDYPKHILLAEESGIECRDSAYRWIVDPLDGTANYVQGIPIYGVSVALKKNDTLLLGVVYHVDREEMFWAVKGEGAYLNGKRIHVSPREDMAYSMLASGFPWRSKDYLSPYMDCFKELFLKAAGLRRLGSAAIDLAYTACGRFDGFWEMKLGPWDIAAGVLLVQEAGGVATDFHGGTNYLASGNVIAGNPFVHKEILRVVRQHLTHIR